MSRLQPPTKRFWIIAAGLVLLLVLGAIVLRQPFTAYAHKKALQHAQNASQATSMNRSITEYRLALALEPHNTDYRLKLAHLYTQIGEYDQARSTLKEVGGEKGRAVAAAIAAEEGSGSDYATALGRGVAKSGLGLAQDLYIAGLYRSSERVAMGASDSAQKYVLLTQTRLAQYPRNKDHLKLANEAATKGVSLAPANLELHQLRRAIAKQLDDQPTEQRESKLIEQLQNGKL